MKRVLNPVGVGAAPRVPLFNSVVVARVAGRELYEVYRAHPADFGCPGDFRMVGGRTYYTERGVRRLADVLVSSALSGLADSMQVNRQVWYREGAMA